MLTELNIRNYALIDSLKIEFGQGLNVLTGETGAGKSIIVDALGLILGEKANATSIRKGSQRCEITGIFDLQKNQPAKKFLSSFSLQENQDDLLFFRRELDSQGKSKSFINDKPVALSTLSELGNLLVEIHGQNEHQRLLKSNEQKNFLDRYAGNDSLRESVSQLYSEWKSLGQQLEASRLSEQEKNQRTDLYQFQLQEIDAAKLLIGEEEEMERVLPQLKNVERLRSASDALYAQLYESEGSALERLRKSQKLIESILSLGIDLQESPALLDQAIVSVNEIVNRIETFRNSLDTDPRKLDEIISRQDLLFKLKKKYGKSVQDVLDYREKISADLKRLQGHAEAVQELDKKIEQSYAELVRQCKKLSAARKKFGEKLSAAVEKELKELGFQKARFLIRLDSEKDERGQEAEHSRALVKEAPTPTGLEKIEFLFSANPGEDPQPLKNVVSGGELSRLMLALKKILAQADLVPTLIFDEVDAGIGGSMGHVIGEKLKSLGRSHQLLVITHLPQIAAFAQKQIAVRKNVAGGRTQTMIELLDKTSRQKEIARMLGGASGDGKEPTPASLKHAAELLENAE